MTTELPKNCKTLDELEDQYIGRRNTVRRKAYEREVADLLLGAQLRDARLNLDLTQKKLAERVGKKHEFISRIENDGGYLNLCTLREIIEKGMGGKLRIQIEIPT